MPSIETRVDHPGGSSFSLAIFSCFVNRLVHFQVNKVGRDFDHPAPYFDYFAAHCYVLLNSLFSSDTEISPLTEISDVKLALSLLEPCFFTGSAIMFRLGDGLVSNLFPVAGFAVLGRSTDILEHYFLVGDTFTFLFILNVTEKLFNLVFGCFLCPLHSFLSIFANLGIRTFKVRVSRCFRHFFSKMLVQLKLVIHSKFVKISFNLHTKTRRHL